MISSATSPSPRPGWTSDLKSGFMVFMIALPLCLGIAGASGCPPIAGIYTAIAGGLIATFLSNSQLTIKGPAAGLIVIVLGCVGECTAHAQAQGVDGADAAMAAYRMMLAVGVVSGVLQIIFGAVKGGVLGDFFPSSCVHGLLAAIGVIIMAKQIPVAFGVPKEFMLDTHHHPMEPLDLILHLPSVLQHFNPLIAVIGLVGLAIMFGMPAFFPKVAKVVPSQLLVLLVTVPLALYVLGMPFPGSPEAKYSAFGSEFPLAPAKHLVNVPLDAVQQLGTRATDLAKFVLFPDFTVLKQVFAWKWIALFAIIGSLESLLSSKAVDRLDPRRRQTDLNRDLLAVGVANTAVAFFGGIPMISEIVRSRANIDNGAQTKFSNFFHGLYLLIAVASIPSLLNLIPLAALASMLIFTGFRLAHPREFMHVYHFGREQLVIFTATIIGVLATDLLLGIFIGIGVKLMIHFINGVPVKSLFLPILKIEQVDDKTYRIEASQSAVFSNWLLFRKQIYTYGILQDHNVIVDLANTDLVDHSTMEKLTELRRDFEAKGLTLEITGLDNHANPSQHPQGTRIRRHVAMVHAEH
ncbi:MAG: SulP family inorganic anion transporter [Planctomycetaceae bacterium]|nr:SulP family inorganic anion transporter [Planctomycetaceae bacterium]